jgi:hypothetical protein
MEQVLIPLVFYSICASVVLVWTTLLDTGQVLNTQRPLSGVQFVAIPEWSVFELAEQHQSLVIFDLHGDRVASGWSDFLSCWLPISTVDLPRILKWLPPASRVVVCCRGAAEQLDAQTNAIFLQLGIGSVYFLDGGLVHQTNRCCAPNISTVSKNRELRRLTTTEARRR